ncbi:PKD domain-containing protein [Leptospira interrogans]
MLMIKAGLAYIIFFVFLLFAFVTVNPNASLAASSDIVAKFTATRLVGPAPLAVMFDATLTSTSSDMDTFREASYTFDFGDDAASIWPHSGQPMTIQSGSPLAAHVYDRPGNYTIRLRAQLPDGAHSEAVLSIAVQDPAMIFPGVRTICVSPSELFYGCPEGALRANQLPRTYAGKRVLLNRGESFGTISINRNSNDIIIGSYGIGPKPLVADVLINTGRLNDSSADDVTIMDLNIQNGIRHSGSGSRYLIYRNTLSVLGGDNKIEIGGALDFHAERNPRIQFFQPREIFIVDNIISGSARSGQKPHLNVSGAGSHLVIMGNDIGRAEEHAVRLFAVHKGFIAHNILRGIAHSASPTQPSIRHALKIHSGGLLPYADAWSDTRGKWATRYLVLADNILGDTENNGSWTIAIAPQNKDLGTDEGIEDVIIERNRFVRGPHTNTDAWLVGRRITMRNNTRSDGGPLNLSIGNASPSLPKDWLGPYYRQ